MMNNNSATSEPFIPLSRCARILGVNPNTLRLAARTGRVPSWRVFGVRRCKLSEVTAAAVRPATPASQEG
jgi:hypothetical protein